MDVDDREGRLIDGDLRTYWALDVDGNEYTTVASSRAEARRSIERNLPGIQIKEIEVLNR